MIDNSLDGLARSVEQQSVYLQTNMQNWEPELKIFRKRAVSSQSAELKALEARLRETEERLKERQANTKNGYNSPDPREKAKSRQQVATLSSRPTQHDCQIRQSAYSRPFEPDVIQDKLPRLSK